MHKYIIRRYNYIYYKIFKTACVFCTVSRLRRTHAFHRQIWCHNTDYVHINGIDRAITVILAKHCIELADDGSLVIRNMLEQF